MCVDGSILRCVCRVATLHRDTKASSIVSDSQQLQWSSSWDVFVYQQQMENATWILKEHSSGQSPSPSATSNWTFQHEQWLQLKVTATVQDLKTNSASVDRFAAMLLTECLWHQQFHLSTRANGDSLFQSTLRTLNIYTTLPYTKTIITLYRVETWPSKGTHIFPFELAEA